jgi:hypothetical protein
MRRRDVRNDPSQDLEWYMEDTLPSYREFRKANVKSTEGAWPRVISSYRNDVAVRLWNSLEKPVDANCVSLMQAPKAAVFSPLAVLLEAWLATVIRVGVY